MLLWGINLFVSGLNTFPLDLQQGISAVVSQRFVPKIAQLNDKSVQLVVSPFYPTRIAPKLLTKPNTQTSEFGRETAIRPSNLS
jgi:hypothetical protein